MWRIAQSIVRHKKAAILGLSFAVLALILFVSQRRVAERPLLRVGYTDFPPYVVPRSTVPPDGLASQMIVRAAERAQIQIEWVAIDSDIDRAFAKGTIDLFPLLTVTRTRKSTLFLSQPWWENEIALVSLTATALRTAEATAHKRVAIRGLAVVKDLAQKLFPSAELVTIPKMEFMVPALCSGTVDAIFLDVRLLESQLFKGLGACTGKPLNVASIPKGNLSLSTAATYRVRKQADRIFEEIGKLSADGTLSELASRWSIYNPFQSRYMKDVLDAEHRADLLRFGLAFVSAAFILIMIQAARLRRARISSEVAWRRAQESEQRFEAFMNHSPTLAFMKDLDGRLVYVNRSFSKYFNEPIANLLGRVDYDQYSPALGAELRRNDLEVLDGQTSREIQETVRFPSGQVRDFISLKFPFWNATGQKFLGGIALDITERKKSERALRLSQFSIDRSPDYIFWLDRQGKIFYANEAACTRFGYSREELTAMQLEALDPEYSAERFDHDRERLKTHSSITFEAGYLDREGISFPAEACLNYLEFDGEEFTCCIVRDVTERKRSEQDLAHQAQHDLLTGLPNRRLLEDDLTQALELAATWSDCVAILYLDLDGFKLVNDTMGHVAGDILLRQVATRLTQCVIPTGTLARMGGDEFAMFFLGLAPENLDDMTDKILACFREPFPVEGADLVVTASVGASFFPRDGHDVRTLLKNADAAMYESKRGGKNRVQAFTPAMGERARERLELETHLRRALVRDQISLHYQPQISLYDGALVRFEALMRWHHPTLGSVPPSKFIPVAEETSLIVPLGLWALEEACRAAAQWSAGPNPGVGVGVNVSVVQFNRTDFVDTVMHALARTGLNPNLLELELTETVLMQRIDEGIEKIGLLRSLGVRISIDDFGTGYSSLSYLQRLPIDTLKIDRSFIRDITLGPSGVSLVKVLVFLGHSLGMAVVAEGVENSAQLEAVRLLGCDLAQGYFLREPLPMGQALSAAGVSA